MYGCIAALHDHCAALPTQNSSSGSASTTSRLEELQHCLPGALLTYAVVTASCSVQGAVPEKAAQGVLQEQRWQYPDGIVYGLLACQPFLIEPFVEALTAFASSAIDVLCEGAAGRNAMPSYSNEDRVLLALLIGQKMVQHEQLRAALLLGTVRPRSMVSALTEAAASASPLSGGAVAAARQKLLSLQEIHFGAA